MPVLPPIENEGPSETITARLPKPLVREIMQIVRERGAEAQGKGAKPESRNRVIAFLLEYAVKAYRDEQKGRASEPGRK